MTHALGVPFRANVCVCGRLPGGRRRAARARRSQRQTPRARELSVVVRSTLPGTAQRTLHDGSQKNGGQARSLLGCLEAPDMGSMRAALLFAVLAAPAVLPGCAVEAEPPAVGGYATVHAGDVPPERQGCW